ncbi:MAG: hypothetical protein FJ087_03275 [Deltaproteobacteria bacterium]|nr:hypothetical protein [Deltaproteobacteria bacterium]
MCRKLLALCLVLAACEGSPSGPSADATDVPWGDGSIEVGPSDVAPDAAGEESPDVSIEVPADAPGEADDVAEDAPAETPGDVAADAPVPPSPGFAAPTGLAASADWVVVANSEFDGATMSYGPGSVTVVRRSDFAPVARIPTSKKNPAAVAIAGGRAFVLCAGETSWDAGTGLVTPASDAALDVFDLASIATATGPAASIAVPRDPSDPLVGYPTSLALSPDGKRAWAGSGTSAAIFEFDLEAGTVVHGADDAIMLGSPEVQDGITVKAAGPGRIIAGSFNRDVVFLIDLATPDKKEWVSVGRSEADMEGVIDLAFRAGGSPDLYVLFAISSAIGTVDTTTKLTDNDFATVGLYPNRIALAGDRLLVVNSGDNNLGAIDLASGAGAKAATFPEKTNPWDVAVDGDVAFVTGNGSNSLFRVDLAKNEVAGEAK